jgi:hypothetical protein
VPQSTVILHGWSDCSDSFVDMKKFLSKAGVAHVSEIFYADYESREDHITFDDVIDGLNDEFYRRGFISRDGRKKHDLNVIVHSTGGLVIRHWIHQHYRRNVDRIADCPIKRLVMLAPANFGSPLAHRGKSFLGSLFKGRWKIGDLLEVGRNLLDGLELASPYQWELAHRDLLIDNPYFNDNQIQLTILVGVKDYTGLRGWINKPGTDGTVVIAGTSLDTVKVRLDFSRDKEAGAEYTPFTWETTETVAEFGFGVLQGLDHGSIVGEVNGKSQSQVGDLLVRALKTRRPADFTRLRSDLDAITQETYAATDKDRYQQFILHAVDEYRTPIADFTVEFSVVAADKQQDNIVARQPTRAESRLSEQMNKTLLSEIHTHSADPSYRRLLVNLGEVKERLEEAERVLGKPPALAMRLYVPDRDRGIRYDVKTLQNVVLHDSTADANTRSPTFFYENTTTLVEMCVNRLCDYVTVATSPQKR